jgi:hypothetical protein
MFVHIVFFKWKKTASKKDIDNIISDLRDMRNKISGIIGLRSGHNYSKDLHDYTHALVVSFKDQKSLDDYRKNPLHQKIVKKIILYEENSLAIDFEDHT